MKTKKIELDVENLVRDVLDFSYYNPLGIKSKEKRKMLTAKLSAYFAHLLRTQYGLDTKGDITEELKLKIEDAPSDYKGAFNFDTLEIKLASDFLTRPKEYAKNITTLAHELTHRAQEIYSEPIDICFQSHVDFRELFCYDIAMFFVFNYIKENRYHLALDEENYNIIVRNSTNPRCLLSPKTTPKMQKLYSYTRYMQDLQSVFMLDYLQSPAEIDARHSSLVLVDTILKKAVNMALEGKLSKKQLGRLKEFNLSQRIENQHSAKINKLIEARQKYSSNQEYLQKCYPNFFNIIDRLREKHITNLHNKLKQHNFYKNKADKYVLCECYRAEIVGLAESFLFNFNTEHFVLYLHILDEISLSNNRSLCSLAYSAYIALIKEPEIKLSPNTKEHVVNKILTLNEKITNLTTNEELLELIDEYRDQFKHIHSQKEK